MEAMNRVIDELQDYVRLQDALFVIEQALETGEIPAITPTFHDSAIAYELEKILNMIDGLTHKK
ncbi:hypothetical protein HMPREF2132_11130 [Prevotella histicola JCM 15637 = DNF00424]|uniref:Uncharacterized protein n=2 Tax=Prevotella histicola TaxID=470565 RepID=A0AAW3FDM5_9BACT|nr:hypothetical protein HMPREF2132_11130 [Prevotella histicola JCM 15637 = DNF00424]